MLKSDSSSAIFIAQVKYFDLLCSPMNALWVEVEILAFGTSSIGGANLKVMVRASMVSNN